MSSSIKSFVLFTVWAVVTMAVFRPFSYFALALLVALGTMGSDFVAGHSRASSPSLQLLPMAKLAAANALVAAALVTGLFYLLVMVNEITGPNTSYSPPSGLYVFARAFLCSLLAALVGLVVVRRLASLHAKRSQADRKRSDA